MNTLFHLEPFTGFVARAICVAAAIGLLTAASTCTADTHNFERDVAPLLAKYCAGCHNEGDAEADLKLDSVAGLKAGGENGPVIVPRDAAKSLLLARITGRIEPIMPPEGEPRPTDAEIQVLTKWITEGALLPSEPLPSDQPKPLRLKTPDLPPSETARPITAIATSSQFVAVGRFGQVELQDRATGREVRSLTIADVDGNLGKVNHLHFGGDGESLTVASGVTGLRGEATLWNATDGQLLQRFTGHRDVLYAAELSPAGDVMATASYDRDIILWDAATGKTLRTLAGHNGAVFDVAFSPDGTVLASASADATVKIWHVATGRRLDTRSEPLKEQYSVDISHDGRWIAAGGDDNRVRVWELKSLDQPQINPLRFARFAHDGAIHAVRFTPDDRSIISAATDETLKVWQTSGMQLTETLTNPSIATLAIAVSADSDAVLLGGTAGEVRSLPLSPDRSPVLTQSYVAAKATAARDAADEKTEEAVAEHEPNDTPATAQRADLPIRIAGTIYSDSINESGGSPRDFDQDLFHFAAEENETWIFETRASRDDSPLDSHVSVLTGDGEPIPRVKLRAVRDSYFTFRGKDSDTISDFRVHNWEEMRLNQFLYAAGEVVKLFHYPRGPDSGFNVYPNHGKRYGYFDTTPLSHALHQPCYIVEPYPPSAELPPNGLPEFILNYENDDESRRSFGSDSQLTFVAPHRGDFLIRVRDVRGMQGADFRYTLTARQPQPDFQVRVTSQNPKVAPGTARKIDVSIDRFDGFDGPVQIEFRHLPDGFSVMQPIEIEAGHDRAWAALMASANAPAPTAEACAQIELVASAIIRGAEVQHTVGSALGEIELGEEPSLLVNLHGNAQAADSSLEVIEIRPGETIAVSISVDRQGFDGRINFGSEDAAINTPHGVYVANSGLNGVLIVENQDSREFFLTAEPWVEPVECPIFVEAQAAGNPCSNPVILRVLPLSPNIDQQAARKSG